MKTSVLETPALRSAGRAGMRPGEDHGLSPERVQALKWWCVARADEWFAEGELGAARDFLRHAAALDPRDDCVWLALGSVHYLLGELAEAGLAFLRAVRLRPGHARAWLQLALVHERMGQPGLAVMLVRQARELDPNDEAIRVAWERLERSCGCEPVERPRAHTS